VTPLWHGVDLCRELTSGDVEALPTIVHVLYLVVAIAVGAALTVRAQQAKLRR
jgi:lipooligosaccharide transport system permease protein